MRYDFDAVIDRRNTDSLKWDALGARFGNAGALPMWVADMDFPPPTAVREAICARATHGLYGYTLRPSGLNDAIVGWLGRRHDWEVKPEWLAYTPGVVPALALAVQAFSHPGDKVIVQPPVYHPFFAVIRDSGRQIVNNPLRFENGRYEMDFDGLERLFDSRTKMLILCSPHNPVGRVWTRDELTRLAEACARHGVLVVSDEIHCDLALNGAKHVPLAAISEAIADSTVTCIAPSKTFNLAGLATSAVVIPNARLRRQFANAVEAVHVGGNNAFGGLAWEVACREGEEWLDQLLEYLAGNLRFLTEFVAERIPDVKVVQPEGTYLVWLDCRGLGLPAPELKDFLTREAGVALNDGAMFGPGGEGFQRMNIACPRALLAEGLERIAAAVGRLRASRG